MDFNRAIIMLIAFIVLQITSINAGILQNEVADDITCEKDADCNDKDKCKGSTCICVDTKCEIFDCTDFDACKSSGGTCAYDKEKKESYCDCPETKPFNDKTKECTVACEADADCENGANCLSNVCKCLEATSGFNCEIVDCKDFSSCENSGGTCKYDVAKTAPYCECPKTKPFFVDDKECQATCKVDTDCENGAQCVDSECKCLEFTSGTKCEAVVCKNFDASCKDSGGTCKYDIPEKQPICDCPKRKPFNVTTGQCEVAEIDCQNKVPYCKITKGQCEAKDGKIECVCPDGGKYDLIYGCIAHEVECKNKMPKCQNTNGKCIQSGDTTQCACPGGRKFDEKLGCAVIVEDCEGKVPKCKITKGQCLKINETTIVCGCPEDGKYDEKLGCEVPEKDCTAKLPKCKITKGQCVMANKNIECVCPNNVKYDDQKGCPECDCGTNSESCQLVNGIKKCKCKDGFAEKNENCEACDCGENYKPCRFEGNDKKCECKENFAEKEGKCEDLTKVCNKEHPKCIETRGYCNLNVDKKVTCVCPNKTNYVTDKGCIVSNDTCLKEKPKCLETKGTCNTDDSKEIQCSCPEKLRYIASKGCGDVEAICKDEKPRCLETKGLCNVTKESKIECVCAKNKGYTDDKGCIVLNATCKKEKPKCLESNGLCNVNEKEEVVCTCPEKKAYLAEKGCIVLETVCKENKPKCQETSGSCSVIEENKIICVCPKQKEYNDTKGCAVNRCKEKCGTDISAVECKGEPFGETEVACNCKNDKMAFSADEKTCKDVSGLSVSSICGILVCVIAVVGLIVIYVLHRKKASDGPTYKREETVAFESALYNVNYESVAVGNPPNN